MISIEQIRNNPTYIKERLSLKGEKNSIDIILSLGGNYMLDANLFGDAEKIIPADCDVVVVADLFLNDYVGGAELTTEALTKSAPNNVRVHKIHSKDVTMKTLESGYQKYWVFANFAGLTYNCCQR